MSMKNEHYPILFDPIRVGHLMLPNRVIMGSMHTGLEESKGGMEALARFYAERAAGGAALIVTGGISPNREGMLGPGGARMQRKKHAQEHRVITEAVHGEGGRICMQILHGGRYSYHPFNVAPAAKKAPINRFKPRKLSNRGVLRTIRAFVRSAKLAQSAGYDGVEVMGSEGYLINQFLVEATNNRNDQWGGTYKNRMRFPVEIVRQIREACGPDFVIMYRLSMLDLVPNGSSWEEVIQLAKAIETAGANVINTGIGWHEARIPTIATLVPRGHFSFVTEKLKGSVNVPLVATNRFNNPETCEMALREGVADLISMARPFLADPEIVNKSETNRSDEINTCIGCNQACLDHIFKRKVATCLVNPRASHEGTWPLLARALNPRRVAVVGSGPAGLSASIEAARLGHHVELFEESETIGGQFNLAKTIPGKEEFHETLRYFQSMLAKLQVKVHLNRHVTADDLSSQFDSVILATGIRPRSWSIPGLKGQGVSVGYTAVLKNEITVGTRVAIIGAGGIGFDVADYLTHDGDASFSNAWGIDQDLSSRGGLVKPGSRTSKREVHLFQRSSGKVGARLGKTTGWIHRKTLKDRGVQTHSDVEYQKWDDGWLYFTEGDIPQKIKIDHVVVCVGQEERNELVEAIRETGMDVHTVGGALNSRGLDAQRAIREGLEAAYNVSPWKVNQES